MRQTLVPPIINPRIRLLNPSPMKYCLLCMSCANLPANTFYRGSKKTIFFKVSKGAKIRNRYNQVPHLTQDTNGKATNSQKDITSHITSQVKFEPRHEISNNVVCATSKASDQPVHTRSLIRTLASLLNMLRMLSY